MIQYTYLLFGKVCVLDRNPWLEKMRSQALAVDCLKWREIAKNEKNP